MHKDTSCCSYTRYGDVQTTVAPRIWFYHALAPHLGFPREVPGTQVGARPVVAQAGWRRILPGKPKGKPQKESTKQTTRLITAQERLTALVIKAPTQLRSLSPRKHTNTNTHPEAGTHHYAEAQTGPQNA